MFDKLLEKLTGKDDVERIAWKEDINALNAYLRTRRLLVPQRPKRFLDASDFTEEQLLEHIRQGAEELAHAPFEPWVLEVAGKRRLPAFSSRIKLEAFSARISQELNKVFGLGAGEILLEDLTKELNLDFIDLNLYSKKSWEIALKKAHTE